LAETTAPPSNGSLTSQLSFTISVGLTPGYYSNTTLASKATLIVAGQESFSCPGSSCNTNSNNVTASATFTGTPNPTTIIPNPLTRTLTNTGLQTLTQATTSWSPNSNSFNIAENLVVTADGKNNAGYVLRLNTVELLFRTVPEPASVAMALVGTTGIMLARRRRRIS